VRAPALLALTLDTLADDWQIVRMNDGSDPPFWPPPPGWKPGDRKPERLDAVPEGSQPAFWPPPPSRKPGDKRPEPDAVPDGVFTARGRNGQLTVTPSKIMISRRGFLGFGTHGHAGEKEIDIDQITSIQVKKPGLATVGYIQFAFMGGSEAKHGIKQAVNDENTVLFAKKVEDDFLKAKELIDRYRDDLRQRRNAPTSTSLTPIEQLERLAALHEQGVVTDDEFAAKKKELLGL
jgi:hypothetical protein